MKNLTELSLKNKNIVWYFIVAIFILGVFSYMRLGRMEDPAFTIRRMVVSAAWPGATADEMQRLVTDKLEKKLQETEGLDYLESYAKDGQTVIYVNLRDDVPKNKIRSTWRDVRNFCDDIKNTLPEGVIGPMYDDRFDDVYGSVYAVTGDGFSYEEKREAAEKARDAFLNVPDVSKVVLLGMQPETIYIETDREKLASLGISPNDIVNSVRSTGQMTPAGMVENKTNNVRFHVTGVFQSLDDIEGIPIFANGRTFRLGDVATVTRGYQEPAQPKMFYNGQPAIGVAVSMRTGGNILTLGQNLQKALARAQAEIPLGLEINQVSNQPQVVRDSISEFVSTLREAIIIVLFVSFLSLGVRTGLVVAFCIPLVLAGVFLFMYMAGIDLQKVSLGALIISLGLLVDDEIIAVEMMSVKLEEGLGRFEAACHAFRATAKPMLFGTLITAAGFIPVAFSKGVAAEFCASLFPVIACALLISWLVSVMVAPLLGYSLIHVKKKSDGGKENMYQGLFYRKFRSLLHLFLRHRVTAVVVTVLLFGSSLVLFSRVRQDFFPPSLRPEIIVGLRLPEGSSEKATEQTAKDFASFLETHQDEIDNYSYYVGQGVPRFVLTIDPVLPSANYAQFVIVSKDVNARKALSAQINQELDTHFSKVVPDVKFIQTGPPAEAPVMMRVSGPNLEKTLALATEAMSKVCENKQLTNVHLNWREKNQALHIEVNPDKVRELGLSSEAIAQMLYAEISGAKSGEFYQNDQNIDVDFRLKDENQDALSQASGLPIYTRNGTYVPLSDVAKISYVAEHGLIWTRDRQPTVTVEADILSGTPTDEAQKVYNSLAEIRASLPEGYTIEPGGSLEDSQKALNHLMQPAPAMIFVIMTLLMLSLQRVRLMIITLLTAPLGLIGVAVAMLTFGAALGFVADLGILALFGMIIRNSIILIDQIQKHMKEGETQLDAIVDSAVLRFRPIMLTAAAAILGMIPLMRSPFWGPMAVAIAGGLLVATVLTLLVLPVFYALVYHVHDVPAGKEEEK